MAHETFISHSSADKVIADAVTAALEQANIRCWIAPRDIRPGDSWGGAIVAAIETSRVMVVIFSSKSNDSKQVMREVERAVKHDVVVVPFRIEDVQPTRDMEYFLSSTHWLDAMSPEMGAHLEELTKTVANILERVTDQKTLSKASKKAAAAMPKALKGKTGSKFTGILTGAMVVVVLGLAALFLLGGDDSAQQTESALGASASTDTIAAGDQKKSGDIKLKFEETVRAGAQLPISWTAKSSVTVASNDFIVIAQSDAADNVTTGYERVRDNDTITMQAPQEPGDYEVRFYDSSNNKMLASSKLSVKLPEVTMSAPASGTAGSSIKVDWAGPNDRDTVLTIAEQGSAGTEYLAYASIAKGSPTSIRLPDLEGEYEVRFVPSGKRAIWKTQSIEVVRPDVSIEPLPVQVAAAEVNIKWQGPANNGDYLAVAETDAAGDEYIFYAYVKKNKVAKLRLPGQAGDFELRYVSGQSNEIWTSEPLTIEMPSISVVPPSDVKVGDTVKISWEGPANRGDYLSVAEPGSEGGSYAVYKYLKVGKVAELQMPEQAGEYEIRYISAVNSEIWFSAPFTLAARTETINAPAQVTIEETFTVSWSVDGDNGQYVGLFPAGSADEEQYATYSYTKQKTATKLRAPSEPGDYELRYMSGNEKVVWARRPIKVVAK